MLLPTTKLIAKEIKSKLSDRASSNRTTVRLYFIARDEAILFYLDLFFFPAILFISTYFAQCCSILLKVQL